MRSVGTVVAVVLLCWTSAARAADQIALAEVLASWQGDANVEFVELAMTANGQQDVAGSGLLIDVASGDPAERRTFTFAANLTHGDAGTRILVATNRLATVSGLTPDFVLPDGTLAAAGGRVCYATPAAVIDCVAWGSFAGDTGAFGKPVKATPDDRSLLRVARTGVNRSDWQASVEPAPATSTGAQATLQTLCGDGNLSQGEQCDGTLLDGKTCADLGFSKGKLACDQCHFDTSGCTYCGNGSIDRGEECDGDALGDRTCEALGFTGGTLACTTACKLTTAGCDPTFFVTGGGPRGPDCLGAWQVRNGGARPGADGKAPVRQRCRDGDPACDGDQTAGTCTFSVAICLDRNDARLKTGTRDCTRPPVGGWTALRPRVETGGTDAALATTLVAAVAALGPSTVAGDAVTFAPALDATARCTPAVPIVVPRKATVVLRAATAAATGHPRDVDTLKLVCAP